VRQRLGEAERELEIATRENDLERAAVLRHGEIPDLQRWYVDRFFSLRDGAFKNPQSYFHKYSSYSDEQAKLTATRIWETINLVNLRENVLPTRPRADLVLRKGSNHAVRSVFLRKL